MEVRNEDCACMHACVRACVCACEAIIFPFKVLLSTPGGTEFQARVVSRSLIASMRWST